ncbi:membrane protein [Nocardia neocaledoniensis NBRC 108232]|uniref:ABC-2 family transporter n=1 Tax=Nocardia neocaledoniensis TaxID=236511 RepID=A0A317N5P1_9NOCA|nr:hypothetical protein [Nocardia neocaledoniensis]PWV70394.1 hypothetical protein DFR69_113107 [Nocardia neocaledoniensis]GEM34755.1 membrane protein [Nocardia neocaledoniensis NBRC 108232]
MTRSQFRHVAGHLLTPLLMCLGMALAYLGAFHQPTPNHLALAVVGDSPQAMVLAQTIKDKAGPAVDIVTLPSRDAAVTALDDRELTGAFVPGAQRPELLVATAGSDTSAMAAEVVFRQVTDQQGVPLTVTDVTAKAGGDPTGQGLFFLLVALSVGAYGSVAVIGAAGATLRMRVRAAIGVGTAFVVSVIGVVVAGPVFDVIDQDHAAVFGIAWLYSAGIILIGIGLHTFLKRWTTLALITLFVMLNFTTSGGVYGPQLQNGFFGALHTFWNGADFVEGLRSLLYFDSTAGFGGRLLGLVAWLAVGALLVVIAGRYEARHAPAPVAPAAVEEEIGESVAV